MQPYTSNRLQHADVSSLNSPEAALRLHMNDPSFYSAAEKTQSEMPEPSWEAGLKEEIAMAPATLERCG